MQWTVTVSAPTRYAHDFGRFSLVPFTWRTSSIYHSVRGQFKLREPFAHYGFQTDGYISWGVRDGPAFKGTVFQYLRAFGFSEEALNDRIYVLDPLNMYSYGWYIEEPYPSGQVGAHILHGALKSPSFMSNSYGRGVDVCFNHDRRNDPTYFPPPSSAFFEDANSYIYTGRLSDPRITCPALIRTDWWDRLRFYIRIFDTVYILRPTNYARRCYYRLIEDELPARMKAVISTGLYKRRPLIDVARELFGSNFPTKIKAFGYGVTARVGFDFVAPSFAQGEPRDAFAPYPLSGILSPTPPFISEVPSLVNSAVGKEMTYSPYTPGPCMFPGPVFQGNWVSIDGEGIVPVVTGMTEREFNEWRRNIRDGGGGGVTLFQISPDGDIHFVRTSQPFLVWGGTCGDYILLEPFSTDAEMEFTTKARILKEGWFTTPGGVRFYAVYFVQASATLQVTTYHLDEVGAYEPPDPEKIEEIFFPYFHVERVHRLLKGARKLLLKPKSAFIRPSKSNFAGVLNELINEDAYEYVSVDFGTTYPELASSFPGPQWLCSNVNVWHLGGAQLPVEWYSDKISAYYATKRMDDPAANRRFFVGLVGPLMDQVVREFVVPRVKSRELEEIIARYSPTRVALTGWKGFDVSASSPKEIPWTMTSSGNIYTVEDKATLIGMFQLYSDIPVLPRNNDGMLIARRLLSQLPVFHIHEALPDGYVMLPLPQPYGFGPGEVAFGGEVSDGRSVVIIGLGTGGSWGNIGGDIYRLRDMGYEIVGLGAWTSVPIAMLYRDPSEPKKDTKLYPNKLLFISSCVEPPEIQVIPGWLVWSGSILLYSVSPSDPSAALEPLSGKEVDVARKMHVVNSIKWRLRSFPSDWETFERILPFLDFTHIPFVETARSVVEWDIVNGRKVLKLANYYQPLIIADIKPLAPIETAAFEGTAAGVTCGSSVTVAVATRREMPTSPILDGSLVDAINRTIEEIYGKIMGKVDNIGGLTVQPPHNYLTSNLGEVRLPTQASTYFGDATATSAPSGQSVSDKPSVEEREGRWLEVEGIPMPYHIRSTYFPIPVFQTWMWDWRGFYSDIRKILLELASVAPVTLPSFLLPEDALPPNKVDNDPLLFFQRLGREGFGKALEFWEKCSLVSGNGRMAAFALVTAGSKPLFGGRTLLGAFYRDRDRQDYSNVYFPMPLLAPWASQIIQNITNLAAGKEIFREGAGPWERYILKEVSPYHYWLGLEMWTSPVVAFFAKSAGGVDLSAHLSLDKGREVTIPWPDDAYPPVGDKGWQFLVGYRQEQPLVAHLAFPPLPSDFFELERSPIGAVRDYGIFWRKRFKNQTFPGDLFTFVPPPLGWLGCTGVPGVSRLGIDPILGYDRHKRFEEGSVEYAYGNKEILRQFWVEKVKVDGDYATKEYYLEMPSEDTLALAPEERLYEDDKEIRESGELEGRRLITLCERNRWQNQRIYWSFRSYFDIKRTRAKIRGTILAPEEVHLGVMVTNRFVLHRWVEGHPRFYLLPLFPVQWWGIPLAFSYGQRNYPFWRDLLPNEYGSITFSLSVAYPIPFGRLKERLKQIVGSDDREEWRTILHRTLGGMQWLSPALRPNTRDSLDYIPDNFLVGYPWYAPFAAYYITEQPMLPFTDDTSIKFALVEDFRTFTGFLTPATRSLQANCAPTVFPEWYARQRRVKAFLGRLNWRRLLDGAARRYPVCIVAQRSPFVTGGAVYLTDADMLFYFSYLNLPDPLMRPALPEDVFAPEAWLSLILSPVACKVPSGLELNSLWERRHTARMNTFVDYYFSGLFATNFTPPFALVPYQTYPLSIPPWIIEDWQLGRVPYWLHDILPPEKVTDGFTCDAEDLLYHSQQDEVTVRPRVDPSDPRVLNGLITFRDCAMPRLTIGLNTFGGYPYLPRIILPPTPIIVHSSFNFGYAEHRDIDILNISDAEKAKTFRLTEIKLKDVPYQPYTSILVRNYFYGMRLNFGSSNDPKPLSDIGFSPMRRQGVLTQSWGIALPIRFYLRAIRRVLNTANEWLEGNEFVRQERPESPVSFYGKLIASLPAFIFALKDWTHLPFEIVDIAFSELERLEVLLVLRGTRMPRYWWLNIFNPEKVPNRAGKMEEGAFSKVVPLGYLVRLYYPIRLERVSPWHSLLSPSMEEKLVKMYAAAPAFVEGRPLGRSIVEDAKRKRGFIKPWEMSLIPRPLSVIRLDVVSRRLVNTDVLEQWWSDWKEHLITALRQADDLVLVTHFNVPFVSSKILESFLAARSFGEEIQKIVDTPVAVLAKILLEDINAPTTPFLGRISEGGEGDGSP